jgi:hypothetical protein
VEFCGYKAGENKECGGGRETKKGVTNRGKNWGKGGRTEGLKQKKKKGTKRDRTQGNFWSLNQQQMLVLLPPFVFVLNREDLAETQTKKKNWGNWTEKEKKKTGAEPRRETRNQRKEQRRKKTQNQQEKTRNRGRTRVIAGAYKGTEAELWSVIHHAFVS